MKHGGIISKLHKSLFAAIAIIVFSSSLVSCKNDEENNLLPLLALVNSQADVPCVLSVTLSAASVAEGTGFSIVIDQAVNVGYTPDGNEIRVFTGSWGNNPVQHTFAINLETSDKGNYYLWAVDDTPSIFGYFGATFGGTSGGAVATEIECDLTKTILLGPVN